MHSKNMVLALLLGMSTTSLFAEPALQEGDTLESLSKVRISVTLQEPLAVEVDTPELDKQQQNMGLLQALNHKLPLKQQRLKWWMF